MAVLCVAKERRTTASELDGILDYSQCVCEIMPKFSMELCTLLHSAFDKGIYIHVPFLQPYLNTTT
jgi:hypothetical protein